MHAGDCAPVYIPPFCPPVRPGGGELSHHCRNLPFSWFYCLRSLPGPGRPPACRDPACRTPAPALHLHPSPSPPPPLERRLLCTDQRARSLSAATHGRRAGRDEPRRRPAAAPSFCSSSMPSMHLNPGSRCRRAAIAAACASSSEPRSQRGEYIDRPRNPFHLCMQHAELQICVHGYQRPSAQTYDHNQLRSSIMRV